MASILDIRRRIRSVTQHAADHQGHEDDLRGTLRKAQDRALAARPYAQMLTNVLKSLVARAEIFDPVTGEAEASIADCPWKRKTSY